MVNTRSASAPCAGPSRRWHVAALVGLSLPILAVVAGMAPIPQPAAYHNFADQRVLLGIPHFWNVISNLPFAVVGLLGVWWLIRAGRSSGAFTDSGERVAYLVFFVGEFLTCFGSGYYHAGPTNGTLMWDRLAFSLLLTSFFAIVVTEFLSARAGRLLLAPMVLLGMFSVFHWSWTESAGRGDLRLYVLVQFYPVLAIPIIMLLFRSRYTRAGALLLTWVLYSVAKTCELADAPIYQLTGFVSGHTLKHFVAAGASYLPLCSLRHRSGQPSTVNRVRHHQLARAIPLTMLGALLIRTSYWLTVEPSYYSVAQSTPHLRDALPRTIAHKAKTGSRPGNTLEAIREAIASPIQAIEVDISLRSDGLPVVSHDAIQTDAVLLRDVLALQTEKYIFLDIKDFGVRDTGFAEAVVRDIERSQLLRTVIVESFNPVFLHRMRSLNPRIMLMFDFADDTTASAEESQEQLDRIPWFLRQEWGRRAVRWWIRPDVLGPRFSVRSDTIHTMANLGYPIVAWSVDDPGVAMRLFDRGVIAIQTNEPLMMAAALGRYPRTISDASQASATAVDHIVSVRSESDVARALDQARTLHKHISIAGVRHSMGGQTFGADHIVLDMTGFRALQYRADTGILTAQAGASWEQIQHYLDPLGRAVSVMQSDNIFTVGGSLSVNVHGWQPGSAPIASTVRRMRVMLASGDIVTCSRDEHEELFRSVLGGYGLLGVILDADLLTTSNRLYETASYFVPASRYPEYFSNHVTHDSRVELAYGRLSVDDGSLLHEAGLHVYYRVDAQPSPLPPMEIERFVELKRQVFRLSERSDAGKIARWGLEKHIEPWLTPRRMTRNEVMSPDIHLLWPVDSTKRDVLQEYFVPADEFSSFLAVLRNEIQEHGVNLLNVTIRDVRQDSDTVLNYARADMFAFVLFLSQDATPEGEQRMKEFTTDVVGHVLDRRGTFYLPYRPHYTRQQFLAAYPGAQRFFAAKQRFDPDERFSSAFYEHVRDVGGPLRQPITR